MPTEPSFRNMINKVPFKETIKAIMFRPGERERAVLAGALKGLRFRFDLRKDTQEWRGIYEEPLQKWLCDHVEPGATCLDIGAANGYFTVLMAKLAGPDGAVYAFEGSRRLCERITYHVELNCRDNALAPVSVYDRFVVGDETQSDPPGVTVDSVVRNAALERVDVIKIDVDGAEADVLRGASRTLERFRPHLFVEVHSRDLMTEVRRIASRYGYTLRLENAAPHEHRPIDFNAFLLSKRQDEIMPPSNH